MLRKKLKLPPQNLEEDQPVKRTKIEDIADPNSDNELSSKILNIQHNLNIELQTLTLRKPPISYIYNPLEYAWKINEIYMKTYCKGLKKLIFVGMNPGPFGMCQTGIPFGDVSCVQNWLKIKGEVAKPSHECPHRPVLGFECKRKEQSGDRLWGLFQKLCDTPKVLFTNCFVYNYCPLAFMKQNGCNVTPSEIKDRKKLEEMCNAAYFEIIKLLQPEVIIGIGQYTEKITKEILSSNNISNIRLLRMPHPSPRALNNQNWPEKAEVFLKENNLLHYLQIENDTKAEEGNENGA